MDKNSEIVQKSATNSKRRKNFVVNNLLIKNFIIKQLNESKGMDVPTNDKIAEGTGLSLRTVVNHCKTLQFEPIIHPLRTLTDNVVVNMFNLTRKSATAVKYWFEIMEGISTELNVNLNNQNQNPIPMSPETIALGDKYLDALMKEADDNRPSKT